MARGDGFYCRCNQSRLSNVLQCREFEIFANFCVMTCTPECNKLSYFGYTGYIYDIAHSTLLQKGIKIIMPRHKNCASLWMCQFFSNLTLLITRLIFHTPPTHSFIWLQLMTSTRFLRQPGPNTCGYGTRRIRSTPRGDNFDYRCHQFRFSNVLQCRAFAHFSRSVAFGIPRWSYSEYHNYSIWKVKKLYNTKFIL